MTRTSLRRASGALLLVIGTGLACTWVIASWSSAGAEELISPARSVDATTSCRFHRGDRDAYVFESVVTSDAPNAGAARDLFAGVLSWVVVEDDAGGQPALLRAALTDVVLEQSLTPDAGRASSGALEAAPFFVRIDETCRFVEIGFSRGWSVPARLLVRTLLEAHEVVLPGDAREGWEAEQRDGVGDYTARYSLAREVGSHGALRIARVSRGYHEDADALRMGLRVEVIDHEAEARFDPRRPGWMARVGGREHARFELPGEPTRGLFHGFVMVRDAARYATVADGAARDADFSVAEGALAEAPADPALAHLDRDAARARFVALLREHGREGVYPAARFLSAWLRQRPEEGAALLEDLRAGAIDEGARSAFFLALELAGDDASRDVLTEALADARLTELDRARAAAALGSHGAPTRACADALLAQVREGGSALVANVSLLGLGTMTGRAAADAPLRAELRDALGEELARAGDVGAEVAVLDALGNSGDDAFRPALLERLHEERHVVRAHAAEALGRLPRRSARPLLVEQLEEESAPEVRVAILRSLRGMDASADGSRATLSAEELALAARLLATSPVTEVRAEAIGWLGRAADQPDARGVLAAHFHVEPDVRLRQRIGTYVSAAELRERAP